MPRATSRNHQASLQKKSKNVAKISPKLFKNRPREGSGGYLGAPLEKRSFQDFHLDDFGSILGAPEEHFRYLFRALFLSFLGSPPGAVFCRCGFHFGSFLGPCLGAFFEHTKYKIRVLFVMFGAHLEGLKITLCLMFSIFI